jgi:SWI/SNF-related matrix-associated actin-dependent regulator 1 of chromatin subfamily A
MKLPVFKYQDDGGYLLSTKERYGLHDEMGVGKTATAWRAAEYVNARRGIVVCPAFLRENWLGEHRKFGNWPWRICKMMNIHDYIAWHRGRFDVLICSYEGAVKLAKRIREDDGVVDFVIFDEGHYLKNSTTKRSREILGPNYDGIAGLFEFALHVWHLTGTPMANDPLDIFTFLKMCRSIGNMTEHAFTNVFFQRIKTQYGSRQICKPEMINDLQALIANNSIRRTKSQVGIHLPPIFMTSALVDGDTAQVAEQIRQHPGLERAITAALDMGGLSFLDAQHVATLRRLIGEAKAIPYGYMLEEELQSGGDKRVVFGIHIDAMTRLCDFLTTRGIKCVLVNGLTNDRDANAAVAAFQQQQECQVFLGNIKKAGTGITLTAACEIDLLESDWSPAGNAQAIMRVHRIGQLRQVRARFITLARSFDEVVNRIVAAKTAAIAQIEGFAMHAAPLDLIAQFV